MHIFRTRKQQAKESAADRRAREETLRKIHAATLTTHRHKALAVREANRAQRIAEIVGKFDASRYQESISALAGEYGYKPECMRKLLVRQGVSVPSMRGKRHVNANP